MQAPIYTTFGSTTSFKASQVGKKSGKFTVPLWEDLQSYTTMMGIGKAT